MVYLQSSSLALAALGLTLSSLAAPIQRPGSVDQLVARSTADILERSLVPPPAPQAVPRVLQKRQQEVAARSLSVKGKGAIDKQVARSTGDILERSLVSTSQAMTQAMQAMQKQATAAQTSQKTMTASQTSSGQAKSSTANRMVQARSLDNGAVEFVARSSISAEAGAVAAAKDGAQDPATRLTSPVPAPEPVVVPEGPGMSPGLTQKQGALAQTTA